MAASITHEEEGAKMNIPCRGIKAGRAGMSG